MEKTPRLRVTTFLAISDPLKFARAATKVARCLDTWNEPPEESRPTHSQNGTYKAFVLVARTVEIECERTDK